MDTNEGLTQQELERICELGQIPFKWSVDDENADFTDDDSSVSDVPPEGFPDSDAAMDSGDISGLLQEMAYAAFSEDQDAFATYVAHNKQRISRAAALDAYGRVAELLALGYRVGVSRGSGACANDLGACYYMGDILEQDYDKAKKYYEMAARMGCLQSVINLGYIYEYGRTGKPDYGKAYECYAQAAALSDSSEAVYKLGDMYSRGRAVERNLGKAHALWEHSLELAKGYVEEAQPAIRIAQLLVDPECENWGMSRDPLRALALFQVAEVGLRFDIADGQTYYKKRLQQAIDGQATARQMLDEPLVVREA